MTEKDGKIILTPEEHDEAFELCEQLAYSGGLSTEMLKQATRLETWEVLDIVNDAILLKNSRLQELREVIYDIDDTDCDLEYLQYSLYNREVTNAEIEAVRAYCTYDDTSVYEELKIISHYASLPDAEFIHKIHTYVTEVYAHILRHNFDAEQ